MDLYCCFLSSAKHLPATLLFFVLQTKPRHSFTGFPPPQTYIFLNCQHTIGLSSGIVGTLIAVSKLFDGFTDIFFGTMIDKTHSKLGKARPWMLYGYIGCAVTLVAIFAVPVNIGTTAQYAWFLIAYIAVFRHKGSQRRISYVVCCVKYTV